MELRPEQLAGDQIHRLQGLAGLAGPETLRVLEAADA
ncbi:DNA polymerase III subunit delta, partial [Xanthomonas perforans]